MLYLVKYKRYNYTFNKTYLGLFNTPDGCTNPQEWIETMIGAGSEDTVSIAPIGAFLEIDKEIFVT